MGPKKLNHEGYLLRECVCVYAKTMDWQNVHVTACTWICVTIRQYHMTSVFLYTTSQHRKLPSSMLFSILYHLNSYSRLGINIPWFLFCRSLFVHVRGLVVFFCSVLFCVTLFLHDDVQRPRRGVHFKQWTVSLVLNLSLVSLLPHISPLCCFPT